MTVYVKFIKTIQGPFGIVVQDIKQFIRILITAHVNSILYTCALTTTIQAENVFKWYEKH